VLNFLREGRKLKDRDRKSALWREKGKDKCRIFIRWWGEKKGPAKKGEGWEGETDFTPF